MSILLWIAFELYLWNIEHSNITAKRTKHPLWIAFELYLWNIEHSGPTDQHHSVWVVNCFRIVSLKYWTQLFVGSRWRQTSCELLSNCIFEILNTVTPPRWLMNCMLWIAFELYLWNIEHSNPGFGTMVKKVVNCFRIVSLKYWTQSILSTNSLSGCCELLSNCIFEILNTVDAFPLCYAWLLWIAFELYLWNIEHSRSNNWCNGGAVVNCFRIVSLKYWTQSINGVILIFVCCELLSNCIFEILNTVDGCFGAKAGMLWIAFELYLWNIEHSTNKYKKQLL